MKLLSRLKSAITWKNIVCLWQSELRPLMIIGTCMFAARSSFADWNHVPTGSMKPTILEGDRVLVNRLAYDLKIPFTTWHLAEWGAPERGDIVVLNSPSDGIKLVKRVVGVPGDVLALRGGRLYVNSQPVQYDALNAQISGQLSESEQASAVFATEHLPGKDHAVMGLPQREAIRDFGPVRIPENSYFVMGDNRDNSADSRYFGAVKRDQILGKATAVIASFDPENWHLPRSNRWFRSLDK